MREVNGIDDVVNAVEHEEAFFEIWRNGEPVAVVITPALFDQLKKAKDKKPPLPRKTRGLAPEVW